MCNVINYFLKVMFNSMTTMTMTTQRRTTTTTTTRIDRDARGENVIGTLKTVTCFFLTNI